MPEFEPMTIGDLIAQEIALEAHCYGCGRMAFLEPGSLSLSPTVVVPALEGRAESNRLPFEKAQTGAVPSEKWGLIAYLAKGVFA